MLSLGARAPYAPHRTIEGALTVEMKKGISITLALACWLAPVSMLHGQAPPASTPQSKPSDTTKPPANSQKPDANAFPEDTNSVPVLPSAKSASAEDTNSNAGNVPAPSADSDPVRSPDDSTADSAGSASDSSSSSMTGLDKLLPPPDTDVKGRRGKQGPEHTETAAEDVNVGGYYLSNKNWRAALSRFESAVVLDAENPEAYWGMAEAQRHLGDYAKAKANYLKVLDYDPDGPHGKQVRKALKEPELANAPTASAARPAPR
jgi:hypothetical protein